MQCLVRLEIEEEKSIAKMELTTITSDLMPQGRPNFINAKQYPPIQRLIAENSKQTMMKVVFLMVKDLCDTVNVVRSMNEDQMIEAAGMLLDECAHFRLEDYAMMFAMGKRGQLVKIFDRIDLNIISQMMDEYWIRMRNAEELHMEAEYNRQEIIWNQKPTAPVTEEEIEMSNRFGKLVGIMEAWKGTDQQKKIEKQKELDQIEKVKKYAEDHKLNWEEILKQFPAKKKKLNRNQLADLQKKYEEGTISQTEYFELKKRF